MCERVEQRLVTPDGAVLVGYYRRPATARAVVLIVHGMAEHAGRYEEFAAFLADNDYAVFAFDMRGHGRTAEAGGLPFHLGDRDGWGLALGDIDQWIGAASAACPGLPLFLFGHSMGTFLCRTYAARHGRRLAGLILSGTGDTPPLVALGGLLVAFILSFVQEMRAPSRVMNSLIFGRYGRSVKDRRTEFDWLTRDPAEVDKYIADPACGKVCSLSFYMDLLRGIFDMSRQRTCRDTPSELPIYLFSGTEDPVGDYTVGVLATFSRYQKADIKDIRLKLYQDGRHEMLNEINRKEVYKDVLDWLNARRDRVAPDQSPSSPA